jgi:hypothetical protein
MKGTGKRILTVVLVLGVVLLLGGCDFFAGIFNPVIGKWQMTIEVGPDVFMTQTMEIHGDKTWSISAVFTGGGVSGSGAGSGTYTQDDASKTITITGTFTQTIVGEDPYTMTFAGSPITYSVSGNTMTWTDTTGVLTGENVTLITWTRI